MGVFFHYDSPLNSPRATSAPIYLDHNATTPPAAEVIAAMEEVMRSAWANPSSVHRAGQEARHRVELAREAIARLIHAEPAAIVFTASGTESCNLAIFGSLKKVNPARKVIVTTAIEHLAVRGPVEALEKEAGYSVVRVPVDGDGVVEVEAFERMLREQSEKIALISIQWANNETGTIQPMAELLGLRNAHAPRAIFHSDAIQWVGKMPTDVRATGIDLLSFAGHKFHGPSGAAGLYVRKGLRIGALIVGGPHERARRAGTENVPAIVGFAKACELAGARLGDGAQTAEGSLGALRDSFEQRVLAEIPGARVNCAGARCGRLAGTSNIAFERLEAEAILLLLSERGVYASAGAACSSGSLEPSPVLLAMGIDPLLAHGSVRFSMGQGTTAAEIDRAIEILRETMARLRKTLPVGAAART